MKPLPTQPSADPVAGPSGQATSAFRRVVVGLDTDGGTAALVRQMEQLDPRPLRERLGVADLIAESIWPASGRYGNFRYSGTSRCPNDSRDFMVNGRNRASRCANDSPRLAKKSGNDSSVKIVRWVKSSK